MHIGVVSETFSGERRVALVPSAIPALKKAGLDLSIEQGAGTAAGFSDAAYTEKGATVLNRSGVISAADVMLQVRLTDVAAFRAGQVVIGMADPLSAPQGVQALVSQNVTAFALELIPRITRAQSMDVLSSMATIAGYKAVLLAANALPRMFPLLTTAAGTVTPAHVFVVGVGVAGLQAISTARRLGAVV